MIKLLQTTEMLNNRKWSHKPLNTNIDIKYYPPMQHSINH